MLLPVSITTKPSFPTWHLDAGVYGGSMCNEYIDVVAGAMWKLPPQAIVGSGLPYMVGRICYIFGFTGEQHFADCWLQHCY